MQYATTCSLRWRSRFLHAPAVRRQERNPLLLRPRFSKQHMIHSHGKLHPTPMAAGSSQFRQGNVHRACCHPAAANALIPGIYSICLPLTGPKLMIDEPVLIPRVFVCYALDGVCIDLVYQSAVIIPLANHFQAWQQRVLFSPSLSLRHCTPPSATT